MGPVGSRDGRHEVGNARPILRDAYSVLPAHPRVAVRHVRGVLFMCDGYEADAGRLEEVERIHISGADNAEDVLDAVGRQRLDECFARGHQSHLKLPACETSACASRVGYVCFSVEAAASRLARHCCHSGRSSTRAVHAMTVPAIGRVKNTVQSLLKLIIAFMKDSSASGPRITPSTSGAIGKLRRSKM